MRTEITVRGFVVVATLLRVGIAAADDPIDRRLAGRYFDEAKALCERDAGRLWGRSLCGPMMFADPTTRAIVANQADKEGKLRSEGSVFVGTLPAEQNISNTAFTWAGVRWTMVVWPLPDDRLHRARVLMHESWHRIQDELSLPSTGPTNVHLDTLEGRIWLRLEWTALRTALESTEPQRTRAVHDALVFRAYRRSLFAESAGEERSLEMHEGLADYTGVALADADLGEVVKLAIRQLDGGIRLPSFTRSFAYASGPAYGVLLDALRPEWRKNLSPRSDLGELLGAGINFAIPADLPAEAKKRAAGNDGDRVSAEEGERDHKQRQRLADARAKLVGGPVLRLPLRRMKIQFDPNEVFPMGDVGTVYPSLRIVDEWGILTVTDIALIDRNWSSVTVPAPSDVSVMPLHGPGWAMEISSDWTLTKGARSGDYAIGKTPTGE